MLEGTRRGGLADTLSYGGQTITGLGKSSSKINTLMSRGGNSRSPIRNTSVSRERKKQMIAESAERLSSPSKKNLTVNEKDEDLIFSIKMSKEEYNQYKKTRESVKPVSSIKKPATSTSRKPGTSSIRR